MNEPIDELSLKIDIDVQKDIHKTISSLARAITKLNNAVADVSALDKYAKTLSKITTGTVKVVNGTSVAKATKGSVEPRYTNVNNTSKGTSQELKKISTNGANASNAINKVGKETTKTKKKMDDAKKTTDGYSKTFSKLVRSIGRIAFYRAIRTAIKEVTDSIKNGLTNLREFDSELDTSFKQLSQSGTSLSNSLATMVAPLVKSITPFIIKIADTLANVSNSISEARAALSGASTYTKILTSDSEEWNKQLKEAEGHLLSFDKFESLTQKENKYTGTQEAAVGISVEEANGIMKPLRTINSLISSIAFSLASIATLNLLSKLPELSKWLKTLSMNTQSLDNIMNVSMSAGIGLLIFGIIDLVKNWENLDAVGKTIRITIIALGAALVTFSTLMKISMKETTGLTTAFKLQKIAAGALLTSGILALSTGIMTLISNWKDMGATAKWLVPVLSVLAGVITAIVVALSVASGNWVKAIAVGAMVTGVGLTVGSTLAAQKYADGGMVPTGTTFIAGEAGAEVVHTSSSGTGVTNIEQFTNAMYNALTMYGAARRADVSFGGDVYIDKTKAGQLLESSVYGEGVRVGHFTRR